MSEECPYCHNPVKITWNFCRKCGARLEHEPEQEQIDPIKEEVAVEDPTSPTGVIYESMQPVEETKEEKEEEKKELTDDELVARISDIIVSRETYNSLLKKKKELNNEISVLLDRVKNKLIPKEEALPKIKQLKEEVAEVTSKEKEFENFEAILPIEEIIEDRNNERLKLKKLKSLKGDKALSASTLAEMENKYKNNIEKLNLKLNIELAKMRKTFDAVGRKLKSLQKELEVLYIKSQTGEISESEYEREKKRISAELNKMKKVSNTVAAILAEAR
ncbi:MAG: zinc ribbon domain-containing protein [Candidatus Heimdallarchaeaceae archaeon]